MDCDHRAMYVCLNLFKSTSELKIIQGLFSILHHTQTMHRYNAAIRIFWEKSIVKNIVSTKMNFCFAADLMMFS